MQLKIVIVKELAAGERRVAGTPETVKKFIALGAEVAVEAGAGVTASIGDEAYAAAGATVADRATAVAGADIVLAVQAPPADTLTGAKPGAWVAASFNPFGDRARVDTYGHGIHAAHHPRAVDGHSVVAIERVGL